MNKIYTDGSCYGTPKGYGGWGAVFLSPEGIVQSISSGTSINTDINRLELECVVKVLEEYNSNEELTVYTDSAYVASPVNTDLVKSWRNNKWRTKKNIAIKNKDLWERLYQQLCKKNVSVKKIKGHSGLLWNELSHNIAKDVVQSKFKLS